MDLTEIYERVEWAFSAAPRPEHFTDFKHCEECADHDETLRAFDRDTIGLAQLGNPGWDPMCFVLPGAFQYYFPAMVRLTIDSQGSDSYLDQFLFHITYDGEDSRFFRLFSNPQRKVTLEVLRYIRANMAELIREWDFESDLEEAIALWTKLTEDA